MKKIILVGVVLLLFASLGTVAYKIGWLAQLPIPALSRLAPPASQGGAPAAGGGAPGAAAGAAATGAGGSAAAATGAPGGLASGPPAAPGAGAPPPPPAGATDGTGKPLVAPPPFDGNVALPDWGGTVESWSTTTLETPDGQMPIAGQTISWSRWTQSGRYQQKTGELILSFFAREPMLVDRVVLRAEVGNDGVLKSFPKDVEIWTSMASTLDGPYTQVASSVLTATKNPAEASITFPPVEARFLKFRALTNQAGGQDFFLSQLKVMEAQRPGYVPLMTRHPELQWPGGPNRGKPSPASGDAGACGAPAPPTPPSHPESRRVLIVGGDRNMYFPGAISQHSFATNVRKLPEPEATALRYRPEFTLTTADFKVSENDVPADEMAMLTRASFRYVDPRHARAALLAPALAYDTVVLAQMCTGGNRMGVLTPLFKQALMAWLSEGHKLIIQDSDDCVPGPDYSFIPYKFKTDTPGARGAPGFDLRFVESNQMLQHRAGRPGFLNAQAWVDGKARRYRNELGDANTFVQWDANWCGQLAVRNVNNVLGFALAYARYGRGLIIYDGFDNDQNLESGYGEVALRELSQGFDPDNLPCGARLGDFLVTTETSMLERAAVPGRTYTYPLTVLSNLGYNGTVNLAADPAAGAMPGLGAQFDPASVAVSGESRTTLALTLPSPLPAPSFAVRVKGSDAAGKSSSLCLKFGPPTSGELAVVSTLAPPTKTRKNLEIILDASGSMKTPLAGKKSRWDVALETLQQVLGQLPDDFNVGLRMYGHRESSRSPKTCTDSELVVPIQKLNRQNVLSRARAFKPKGETPLVYSALQSPADLKAVGGGTVILITDGEESCKGDPVKAAADLKASGLDLRLNIVGFALKNPKVQKDLSGFAQSTGGLFYAADSGATLGDALMLAAVEKFPYTVYDAAGKAVLTGDAGTGADQLPAGDYKVVVKAGTRELVAPKVSVGLGESVKLMIAMNNGQLVLR